jgi:hypothetical protein
MVCSKKIFRGYCFVFFIILFFMMCWKDQTCRPRMISVHLNERDHIATLFKINLSFLGILYFFTFCGQKPFSRYYMILPFLVVGIYLTDAYSIVHYVLFFLYLIISFYIIVHRRPVWLCSLLLIAPVSMILINYAYAQFVYLLMITLLI